MRHLIASLALVAAGGLQADILFNGGTFTENFNGMPQFYDEANTVTSFTLPGTGTAGVQADIPGAAGWQTARMGGSGTTTVAIWSVPATGGRLYNYGVGTDRALGSLGSGTAFMGYGVSFINNTAGTIDAVTVSFTRQIWQVQGTSTTNLNEDRVLFAFGTSAAGITSTDFLTNSMMEPRSDLDLVSAAELTITSTVSGTNPDRTRIGSQAEWSQLLSGDLTNLNWAPGEKLFLRWSDSDSAGFDAGLAIDNFSLTVVPEPATVTAVIGLLAGLAVLARRRKTR